MQRPFKVWNADNMPVQAPFYKSPSIPYSCKDLRTFDVYCRGDADAIKRFLAPTPFEFLTDKFIIDFGDYANGTSATYHDLGVILPVRYKNLVGGYYVIEYEDLASSVSAGRELWGYPKKVADFDVEETEHAMTVRVSREGAEIIRLSLDFSQEIEADALPEIQVRPHLLLYTMPRYAGPGIQCQKILKRDTSPDFVTKKSRIVRASATLSGYENPPVIEPLDEWSPTEVYGAKYTIGDFAATAEHGWAELVEVIVADPDR